MKISKGAGMKSIVALVTVGMMMSIANADVVSKNGIAKDSATGLMWQDNADAANVQKDWDGAKRYCQDLRLDGYKDWRLPNIYELATLRDDLKQNNHMINGIENIASGSYWSSTTGTDGSNGMWSLAFTYGYDNSCNKTYSRYVRCVRAGQLNFDNLVILKNKDKLKVSQENIDYITPTLIAQHKKEDKERERRNRQNTTSSSGYEEINKVDMGKEGDRYVTDYKIKCDNGKSGYISQRVSSNSNDSTLYCGGSYGCKYSVEDAVKAVCGY
jgi:hypothetical protein